MLDRIEAYVITRMEMLCLASCKGMKNIYGIKNDIRSDDDLKKRIGYSIYDLGRKGYITIGDSDEYVIVDEMLNSYFDIINNALKVYDILKINTHERIIIYINGHNAVVIRQCATKEDENMIFKIPHVNIVEHLLEEGYIGKVVRDIDSYINVDLQDYIFRENEYLNISEINFEVDESIRKVSNNKKTQIYESYILYNNGERKLVTINNLKEIFCIK